MQGTVQFFSEDRGFGFIERDGGDDVLVHRTDVTGEDHVSLHEGQQVEFEVGPGRKGDQAVNVTPR